MTYLETKLPIIYFLNDQDNNKGKHWSIIYWLLSYILVDRRQRTAIFSKTETYYHKNLSCFLPQLLLPKMCWWSRQVKRWGGLLLCGWIWNNPAIGSLSHTEATEQLQWLKLNCNKLPPVNLFNWEWQIEEDTGSPDTWYLFPLSNIGTISLSTCSLDFYRSLNNTKVMRK